MAERYGWTPNQSAALTWPQIRMFLAPEPDKKPGDKQLVHFTGPDCVAQHAAWNEKRQLKQVM